MKKKKAFKVNKNNSTNILNNINKIKANEKKLLFYNAILMLVVIIFVSYITVFAVGKNNIFDKKYSASNLTHEDTVEVIANKIYLDKSLIVRDSVGLEMTPFNFKIINKKKHSVEYRIKLVSDFNVSCDCGGDGVSLDTLRFSLDRKNIYSLKDRLYNGEYIIMEGQIDALSTSSQELYIWISNILLKDKSKSHFHGLLVLEEY